MGYLARRGGRRVAVGLVTLMDIAVGDLQVQPRRRLENGVDWRPKRPRQSGDSKFRAEYEIGGSPDQ